MWKWAAIVVVATAVATPALACPTCACGNPTITTMGLDAPYENRLRLGLSTRAWETDTVGANQQQVRELRFDLTVSFAPTEWLQFFLNMPLQMRELATANLQRQRGVGPGDLELGARWVVTKDERLTPRWLTSLSLGVMFPTSPVMTDRVSGRPLDTDAQLSLGGFTPTLGASNLSLINQKWSVLAMVNGDLPLGGRSRVVGPGGVRGLAAVQWQPFLWLAARLGPEVRWEGARWIDGVEDRAGAGISAFAAPDLLFMLGTRVVIIAGARIPIASALEGGVRPGPVFTAGFMTDVL